MKATPQRIQRRRTKGYKLPENSISVTRPGKWGNFLKVVGGEQIFINAAHRRKHLDPWVFLCFGDLEMMLEIYEATICEEKDWPKNVLPNDVTQGIVDLNYWEDFYRTNRNLEELSGKSLACFCPIGSPCHGDVLLKIANE